MNLKSDFEACFEGLNLISINFTKYSNILEIFIFHFN